jgi:hypothetical protein
MVPFNKTPKADSMAVMMIIGEDIFQRSFLDKQLPVAMKHDDE